MGNKSSCQCSYNHGVQDDLPYWKSFRTHVICSIDYEHLDLERIDSLCEVESETDSQKVDLKKRADISTRDTLIYKINWSKIKRTDTLPYFIVAETDSYTIFKQILNILDTRWSSQKRLQEWKHTLEDYFNWISKDNANLHLLLENVENLPCLSKNACRDPYQIDNQNIIAFLKPLFIALQKETGGFTRQNGNTVKKDNKLKFALKDARENRKNNNFKFNNKKDMNEDTNIKQLLRIVRNFVNLSHKGGEAFYDAVCQSCLLPYMETITKSHIHDDQKIRKIQNFEDSIFKICISIMEAFVKTEDNLPLLFNIKECYTPKQAESLHETMVSSKLKLEAVLKDKNYFNNKKFREECQECLKKVTGENVKKLQTLGLLNEDSKTIMIEKILEKPIEHSYPALLENSRVVNQSLVYNEHHYAQKIFVGNQFTQARTLRIAKELDAMTSSLPCNHTNSIFVRVDSERSDVLKVLIFGAEGTPYSSGAFVYDVFIPQTFPQTPPLVNLMTTGHGQVRFNPNLYTNGKVCLSLLGTWAGKTHVENWNPQQSTLLQVFISIQSIIMTNDVYFNEPGFEYEKNQIAGKKRNVGYSNIVKYANILYAMTDSIINPPKEFADIIHGHFYLKKHLILKEVNEWLKESNEPAEYTSLVSSHNYKLAIKFKGANCYRSQLNTAINDLKRALDSLNISKLKSGSFTNNIVYIDPENYFKKLEEKRGNVLKNQENNIENLIQKQDIDVSFLEPNEKLITREINIDDSKVKDRWSRYIGAMGIDAVRKQASSKVMLINIGALGVEIAKNIILSGVKQFTLVDFKTVSEELLCGQFFLEHNDIGKNRAEACRLKLSELNYYVKVDTKTIDIKKTLQITDLEKLEIQGDYDVFVLTECSYSQQLNFSKYCRNKGKKLIVADTYGAFGRILNDFGTKFTVFDKDGEEPQVYFINEIKPNGDITQIDDMIHRYEDGDYVMINDVVGMSLNENTEFKIIMEDTEKNNSAKDTTRTINQQIFKVNVVNRKTINIGDVSEKYSQYIRNGIIKQVKMPFDINFKAIHEILETKEHASEPNFEFCDYSKMESQVYLNHCFNSLATYLDITENAMNLKQDNKLPRKYDYKECKSILENYKKELEHQFGLERLPEINTEKHILFLMTSRGVLPPLNAFLGGMVSQEVIKSITNKFMPIRQGFYVDFSDIIPPYISDLAKGEVMSDKLSNEIIKSTNTSKQFYGLEIQLGPEFLTVLSNLKVLMVGAGAIGCELLKNFAMLNISTDPSKNGAIYVTDPDIIENSNLNRQFLFREKHIRKPKSVTAAYSVINMSKAMNVLPLTQKVAPDTENIFSDEFISGLDLIANALDNVQARKYIDNRCVKVKTPLLESGTLGPKGHVQVIIPDLTEHYGAMSDPVDDGEIPYCTLKMFPEDINHCIEWGRDKFEKLFSKDLKTLEKVQFEYESCNKNLDTFVTKIETKQLIESLKIMKQWPKNFHDCMKFAKEKYQKYFMNDVEQLLYTYPLDKTVENGKLFWTMPKRPPTKLPFDFKDEQTCNFIAATSFLIASCFGSDLFLTNLDYIKTQPICIKNLADLRKDDIKAHVTECTKNIMVKEFKISDEKAKKINSAQDKQNGNELEKDAIEPSNNKMLEIPEKQNANEHLNLLPHSEYYNPKAIDNLNANQIKTFSNKKTISKKLKDHLPKVTFEDSPYPYNTQIVDELDYKNLNKAFVDDKLDQSFFLDDYVTYNNSYVDYSGYDYGNYNNSLLVNDQSFNDEFLFKSFAGDNKVTTPEILKNIETKSIDSAGSNIAQTGKKPLDHNFKIPLDNFKSVTLNEDYNEFLDFSDYKNVETKSIDNEWSNIAQDYKKEQDLTFTNGYYFPLIKNKLKTFDTPHSGVNKGSIFPFTEAELAIQEEEFNYYKIKKENEKKSYKLQKKQSMQNNITPIFPLNKPLQIQPYYKQPKSVKQPVASFITPLEDLNTKDLKNMSNKELAKIFVLAYNTIGKEKLSKLTPQLFEKDNDENCHIDFISSVSNIRAKSYSIEQADWLDVKLKAGKIVPALATTTACIAGLQALELLKVVNLRKIRGIVDKSQLNPQKDIETFKNSFLNLSVPNINFAEPGEPKLYKFTEKAEFTIWDRITIDGKNRSVNSLSEELLQTYGLNMVDIYHKNKAIFLEKRDHGLGNAHINNLLNMQETEVDLTITFKKEKTDKEVLSNTPLVRIKL